MLKRFVLGAVLALTAGTGVSQAYPLFWNWGYGGNPYYRSLAIGWVRLYLRRNPTAWEVLLIENQLDAGFTADQVQANILASNEYYVRAGGNNFRFIQNMVADVLGRLPTLEEQSYLLGRIFNGGRYAAALDTLVSRWLPYPYW